MTNIAPSHPLFSLILDYAFSVPERQALTMLGRGSEDLNQNMLDAAAENGWTEIISLIIAKAKAIGTMLTFDAPLCVTAHTGNIAAMELCLSEVKHEPEDIKLNIALEAAAGGGFVTAMMLLIEKGANDFNQALIAAASSDHVTAMKFLIAKADGATDFNLALLEAARNGHIAAMNLVIEHGAIDFDGALVAVAGGCGSVEAMEFIITRATNIDPYYRLTTLSFNDALIEAAKYGNLSAAKLILEQGANNLNESLWAAAGGGFIDVVKLLVKAGATRFDPALYLAAGENHITMMELLIEKGATSFDEALRWAANGGHIAAMKLAIKHGAYQFNRALISAATNGQPAAMELAIAHGAHRINRAMVEATFYGHSLAMELAIRHGANNKAARSAASRLDYGAAMELLMISGEHGIIDD